LNRSTEDSNKNSKELKLKEMKESGKRQRGSKLRGGENSKKRRTKEENK